MFQLLLEAGIGLTAPGMREGSSMSPAAGSLQGGGQRVTVGEKVPSQWEALREMR